MVPARSTVMHGGAQARNFDEISQRFLQDGTCCVTAIVPQLPAGNRGPSSAIWRGIGSA